MTKIYGFNQYSQLVFKTKEESAKINKLKKKQISQLANKSLPHARGSPSLCQGTQIERVPVVLLDLDPAKLGKGGGNPAEQQEEGGFVSQRREHLLTNPLDPPCQGDHMERK
jgi:hypothetical protein